MWQGDIHGLYILRLRRASRVGQQYFQFLLGKLTCEFGFAVIKFVLYRLLRIGPAISARINGTRMWATAYPVLPREKAIEGW